MTEYTRGLQHEPTLKPDRPFFFFLRAPRQKIPRLVAGQAQNRFAWSFTPFGRWGGARRG